MSPMATMHANVPMKFDDTLALGGSVEKTCEELSRKYLCEPKDLADIIIHDVYTMKGFKKAWKNPEHKLSPFEELLIEKILERESDV